MKIKYNLQNKFDKTHSSIIFTEEELYNGEAKKRLEREFCLSWLVLSKCMCIGKADKNNKLIFEKDVVKISFLKDENWIEFLCEVKYSENNCMFYLNDIDSYNFLFRDYIIIEIIGNVHTKHLIEKHK